MYLPNTMRPEANISYLKIELYLKKTVSTDKNYQRQYSFNILKNVSHSEVY